MTIQDLLGCNDKKTVVVVDVTKLSPGHERNSLRQIIHLQGIAAREDKKMITEDELEFNKIRQHLHDQVKGFDGNVYGTVQTMLRSYFDTTKDLGTTTQSIKDTIPDEFKDTDAEPVTITDAILNMIAEIMKVRKSLNDCEWQARGDLQLVEAILTKLRTA